jgi:SAM-dependent methyltransferase
MEQQLRYMREWITTEFIKQTGHQPSAATVDQIFTQMAEQSERWAKTPQLSREQVHDFWRSADSQFNRPEDYLQASTDRSQFLLELLQLSGLEDPSILEIGCNAGRNLAWLHQAGYTRLSGIEISPAAVQALTAAHPGLAAAATLHTAPVEDVIRTFPDNAFDVVFSMAVLVHIHHDSDWVMAEIARICGACLITIEDEQNETPRHFLRNYKALFEALGLVQVLVRDCSHIQGFGPYTARMFRRC